MSFDRAFSRSSRDNGGNSGQELRCRERFQRIIRQINSGKKTADADKISGMVICNSNPLPPRLMGSAINNINKRIKKMKNVTKNSSPYRRSLRRSYKLLQIEFMQAITPIPFGVFRCVLPRLATRWRFARVLRPNCAAG